MQPDVLGEHFVDDSLANKQNKENAKARRLTSMQNVVLLADYVTRREVAFVVANYDVLVKAQEEEDRLEAESKGANPVNE